MLSSKEIRSVLLQEGFSLAKENVHVWEFVREGLTTPIYVKPKSATRPLVLEPSWRNRVGIEADIGRAVADGRLFHNTNMTSFPKRMRGGTKSIHFGWAVSVPTTETLRSFLNVMLPSKTRTERVADDIRDVKSRTDVSATTREALIDARLGQGKFRSQLLEYWRGCSVTGCTETRVLVASHIKPWRASNDRERLDHYNGLLLVPSLDALFDSFLATFSLDGSIRLSSSVTEATRSALGVDDKLKLARVSDGHKPFLAWHNEQFARRERSS